MTTYKPCIKATKPLPNCPKQPEGTDAKGLAQKRTQRLWWDFVQTTYAVETIASVFGMAGALLLAMPALPGWGFAAFLVSNIGWLVFSAAHGHRKLFVQQLVFLVCSLVGLWNWWLGPLLLAGV